MKKFMLFLALLAITVSQMKAAEAVSNSFTSITGNAGNNAITYTTIQGTATYSPYVDKSGHIYVYAGGTFTVTANNGAVINQLEFDSDASVTVSYTVDDGDAVSSTASSFQIKNLTATTVTVTSNSDFTVNYLRVYYDDTNYSEAPAPVAPVFSLESGMYSGANQTVTVTNFDADNFTYYYTTNGTDPTTESTQYTDNTTGITLEAGSTLDATTLKMIAVNTKGQSAMTTAHYTVVDGVIQWNNQSAELNTSDAIMEQLANGANYIESFDNFKNLALTKTYLQIGELNTDGKVTIKLKNKWNISKIVINASRVYGGSYSCKANIIVNGITQATGLITNTSSTASKPKFNNYTVSFDGSAADSITINNTGFSKINTIYIKSITIYVTAPEKEPEVVECTLDELTDKATLSKPFTVTSEVQAVARYYDRVSDKNILLVKGENGKTVDITQKADTLASYVIKAESYYNDDMGEEYTTTNSTAQEDYDQSTWMELVIPDNMSTAAADALVGSYIAANEIQGTFVDDNNNLKNLRMELTSSALATNGTAESYIRNAYTPANFISHTEYFFMPPKACEYAQIVWAVYYKGAFYCPAQTSSSTNGNGIYGLIYPIKWDYMKKDPTLTDGVAYQFRAIVKKSTQEYKDPNFEGTEDHAEPTPAPRRRTSVAEPTLFERQHSTTSRMKTSYWIYPLDLDEPIRRAITTAVEDVETASEVASVQIYNLQGVMLSEMQPGINIIVTRYTDGTTSTTKVLR